MNFPHDPAEALAFVQAHGSPFGRTLGLTYTEVTQDRVAAEIEVRKELCTVPDVLHGGAVMSIADDMGAVATIANLPPDARTTTIESKTNFVRALPIGEVATAESTPLHKGRTTQVWQTRISRADGKLAAVVTQTQIVLPDGG